MAILQLRTHVHTFTLFAMIEIPEIISQIHSFVGDGGYISISPVCKLWRDIWMMDDRSTLTCCHNNEVSYDLLRELRSENGTSPSMARYFASSGDIVRFKDCYYIGFEIQPDICNIAAEYGSLEIVKWTSDYLLIIKSCSF